MDKKERVKKLLGGIESGELKKYTSIGVGGYCNLIFTAKSVEDLMKAVTSARKAGIPYRVIGNGTNVIFADSGFDGLAIVNRASQINIDSESGAVIVESGASLMRLILESVSAGLSGLEALYGIPSSVGGAIIVNCGAHGVTISDFIRSVTVIISSDKIISCPPSWFKFGYRESKLKYSKSDSPPVILSATLQLQHRKTEDSAALVAKYQKWRQMHQPLGQKTSGSVFRNPKGSDVTASDDDKYKSAGYLLDSVGAKNFRVGDAAVSKKHANWIINLGHASASDIRSLVEKMRGAVEDKYHVTLVEEIEYLGDWG